MFMSGLVGPFPVQSTNFTPSALNGKSVIDASCSIDAYSGEMHIILATDDHKVFSFDGQVFYDVGSLGIRQLQVSPIFETTLESVSAGLPIKKVFTYGWNGVFSYAVLWGSINLF